MNTHPDDGSTPQNRTPRSRAVSALVKRLAADTRGSIAIQFALLALVILALAGGAIDFANVATIRTTLQEAADAAATAAVAKTSPGVLAAQKMSGNGTISAGQTDAQNIFNANISKISQSYPVTLNATVTKSGLNITSSITYSINVPLSFLGIIGMNTWTVSGSAKALTNLSPYIDFYLLLDNSPSMGLGATTTDINNLIAATQYNSSYNWQLNNYINSGNAQCALACHDLSVYPNDYYALAKNNNITMRIDVVRTATQDLMSTMQTTEQTLGNLSEFRAAVYTFGTSWSNRALTNVAALNSNLTTVSSQAGNVDIMSVPNTGYSSNYTDFDAIFSSMNTKLPTPGDGSTSSTPQEVLFFVSDGLEDAPTSTCSQSQSITGSGRCQSPINVSNCTTIKNRGIKIAVLYTTYYPITNNWWYNNTVAPFQSQIGTNMQACASPGLYFEVSPTQGISAAMTALFNLALQQVRITN
jgi:Flp pilus assembly protein TadG